MVIVTLSRDYSKDQSKFLGHYLNHVVVSSQHRLYERRFNRGIVPSYMYLIARQAKPRVISPTQTGDVAIK